MKLRALIDRTSLELFGNDGAIAMTSCFLPRGNSRNTAFLIPGKGGQLVGFRTYELMSAWPHAAAKP